MTSAPLPDPERRLPDEAAAQVGGLFVRHGRMVYGVCRAMLRDVHEAEDATQQVFLSAHKALLGGAQVRDPGGWLATIARNECRGRIAAGMKSPLPVADAELDTIPDSADDQARRAQLRELCDALAELPERQREAVVLRYLLGLHCGEVATALGISRPATEALLFRARRALQVRLRPLAGAALVVPLAVRDELALAIPGFSTDAGTSAAAFGMAGGVLAKLTAGPVGVKVATAAVAVSTVGAVGAVEADRPARSDSGRVPIVESRSAEATDADGSRTDSHLGARRQGEGDDDESESQGPGSGDDDGSREVASRGDREHGPSSHGDGDERDRRGGDDAAANPELDDSSGPGPGRGGDEGTSGSGSSGSSGSDDSAGSSSEGHDSDDSSGSGSEGEPDDAEP